ncbi:MAG: spore photoproduct lyase family protein [Bacteriovoracaceae bacterium]
MWNKVYLEKSLQDHPRAKSILSKVKSEIILVDDFEDIWGKAKKPYLHKRDALNLFISAKKGTKVKIAPDAYGKAGEPHYYFIHAYNCIYECQYCYLQGYFNTPDIVLFINHEEILNEMRGVLENHPDTNVWFHAGEFSDSLALTHLTGELEVYHQFCKENPRAIIELRTKSVNVSALKKLEPLENFIVSFSLSPHEVAKRIDEKTPSVKARVKVMKELQGLNHPIAAHFDPIIYQDGFKSLYENLLGDMEEINPHLRYLSLGVVRFTKDVYREVERNYPDSLIHATSMIKSFDNKIRYARPLRNWILSSVFDQAIKAGVLKERIYLCMED